MRRAPDARLRARGLLPGAREARGQGRGARLPRKGPQPGEGDVPPGMRDAGGCCPKAARVLEEAEPDALACLDFPKSHWKRLRTNIVQERTNREIKRRSRVVQVFPSVESLTRLMGALMCEQDDGWSESRYLSERKISELYEETPKTAPLTKEEEEEPMLVSEQAIRASPGLAHRMEAALDTGQGLRSCRRTAHSAGASLASLTDLHQLSRRYLLDACVEDRDWLRDERNEAREKSDPLDWTIRYSNCPINVPMAL